MPPLSCQPPTPEIDNGRPRPGKAEKPKSPSPYWWLLLPPIAGFAAALSAEHGPWPMIVGIALMAALFNRMHPAQ